MVRKLGFDAVAVDGAKPAMEYMQNHQVDIVLTDLWMLEVNGVDLAKMIKKDRPEMPVIAVTADAEAETNALFDTSVLNAVLIKPITFQKLQDVLQKVDFSA